MAATARSTGLAGCALAVGGLDPGGGAGVVADLRAFAAAGVFGCAAVAVLTVQSTAGLRSARPLAAREVTAQLEEVAAHQRLGAVKVGALGSAENVRAVARFAARHPRVALVVDTPMRATARAPRSGASRRGQARLLADGAVAAMRRHLLPRATVVTVNLDEASALLGERVRTVGAAHDAARALAATGARAVLVKGGHLPGPEAIDVLAVDGEVIELRASRVAGPAAHGTGCTFASLVAGRLAALATEATRKRTGAAAAAPSPGAIVDAIRWAKRAHHAALGRAIDVGEGAPVLVFRAR
jgi:hydroxymethylpyrimidine/phosphomethylpyrimidine kinase